MSFIDRELLPGVHHIEDALGVCFTLLLGKQRALLFDAGYGLEDVRAFAQSLCDVPVTLWLSHGHHDHAPGAMWFDEVWMHPREAPVFEAYTSPARRQGVLESARQRGIAPAKEDYSSAPMPPVRLAEESEIDLGGLTARILPLPGHTPGSVVVYVPEHRLLLSGDDWNPTTWLFFPEALDVWRYKQNMTRLLRLPFERVLCPHRSALYDRRFLDAFVGALTPDTLSGAAPSSAGSALGIDTREARLPMDQTLVFDWNKAFPPQGA